MFHGVAKSEILRAVSWATEGSSAQRNDWKISDSKMVVANTLLGLGVPEESCH
jgi:hypothetical protein